MSLHKNAQIVEVKKGDSLILGCRALDVDGDPVSLVGVTVRSQMRSLSTNGTPVNLQLELVNIAQGEFELAYPGTTVVDLDAGDYAIDIEYSASDAPRQVVRSSRTFYVRVLNEVTQ